MNDKEWPVLVPCRKKPEKIYLRFGRWDRRSLNFSTGASERGVSVYPASFHGDSVVLEWPLSKREKEALDGRCVWPVTGKYVCDGSDGEPVLQAVVARPFSIIKTW